MYGRTVKVFILPTILLPILPKEGRRKRRREGGRRGKTSWRTENPTTKL